MKRVLVIPVVGTLLAILVVILMPGPGETEAREPDPALPADPPDSASQKARDAYEERLRQEAGEIELVAKYVVHMLDDGHFRVEGVDNVFANLPDLMSYIAPKGKGDVSVTLLNTSPSVSRADMDVVEKEIGARYEVKKRYRAREER